MKFALAYSVMAHVSLPSENARSSTDHVSIDPTAFATVIDALESDSFFEALRVFINRTTQIDNCVALVFSLDGPPLILHHWSPQQPNYFQMLYRQGAYVLDPFYLASFDERRCGIHLMNDIAPDSFYESDFYMTYYKKVEMIDEIGLLCPIDDRLTAHLSLGRRSNSTPYDSEDLHRLRCLEPLLQTLLKRQSQAQVEQWRLASNGHFHGSSSGALVTKNWLAPYSVTNREAEIAGLILRGHSNISIGHALDISAETVKVHRRNLYSKLQISSQAELFLLFINHILPAREVPLNAH